MYNPKNITGTNHRDLDCVHPTLALMASNFIKLANSLVNPLGFQIKIISTLRTFDEQAAIYAQGRTKPGKIISNAGPGSSMHNWGCAFDIGVFSLDGKVYNPTGADAIYKKVAPIAVKLGLFWGGNFSGLYDAPHYQYTGKYDNSTFLSLAKAGKSIDELLGVVA